MSQSKQISFSFARFRWALPLVLLAVTFLSYYPVWHGQPIWDDDGHMTKPELRSIHGLVRIWFDLGATQQYYPLVHSIFWVEYKLWGDSTWGYHFLNILLHSLSALLLFKVLRRLQIPGAWLAAAIFALHPVHVESVAWITELKNTLSGFFYLASILAYLKFDQARAFGQTPETNKDAKTVLPLLHPMEERGGERRRSSRGEEENAPELCRNLTRPKKLYLAALGLFVLGLMCKTVIASLPAALLVIFWWKRGKLRWKEDVVPLLPFFAFGIASGLFTAWVERKFIGAQGAEFNFSLIERCLIAGRATWFYLGKLFWPANLAFSYPRWHVSQTVWWQYLFPAAALLLLGFLWTLRRRWRGPLAAFLFFVGTLFPALGFLNVYPFRYSFVADHFQYAASLGIITLFSAGVALLLSRWQLWQRPLGYALCATLLVLLSSLAWRQCVIYSDPETLWRDTLARNPRSWQAHDQLGCLFDVQGRSAEAAYQFSIVAQARPWEANAFFNWGLSLKKLKKTEEAIPKFETALRFKPDYFKAHFNLAEIFAAQQQWDRSIGHYLRTIEIKPDDPSFRLSYASVLMKLGRLDEAITQFQEVIRQQPTNSAAHLQLAMAFLQTGQRNPAGAELFEAISSDVVFIEDHPQLWTRLSRQRDVFDALDLWREALDLKFHSPELFNNIAWILATHPDALIRNGPQAIQFAERACQLNGTASSSFLDTLAAAYAEAGRFNDAVTAIKKAIALAETASQTNSLPKFRARLELYQKQKPYHEQ